jgi:hypothetical protein
MVRENQEILRPARERFPASFGLFFGYHLNVKLLAMFRNG